MANATTTLTIEHIDQLQDVSSSGKHQALTRITNFLTSIQSGNSRGVALEVCKNTSAPNKAFGYLTVATTDTGTYTTSVNGVAIDATGGASDAATGVAIAAAINASTDALVQYLAEACNFRGSFALSNSVAGNYVELTLTDGRKWRLTAATDFAVSGTDTQDAAALAAAINAIPILNHHVYAYNVTTTCYVHQRRGVAATVVLAKVGAPITLGAMASSGAVGVSALMPGTIGNAITTAATAGTNYTAFGARCLGGTGLNAAATRYDL